MPGLGMLSVSDTEALSFRGFSSAGRIWSYCVGLVVLYLTGKRKTIIKGPVVMNALCETTLENTQKLYHCTTFSIYCNASLWRTPIHNMTYSNPTSGVGGGGAEEEDGGGGVEEEK